MELSTYTPPVQGDQLPGKEIVGRPLVVQVREHRRGIKTKFNSDPTNAKTFKPEGGDAVCCDVADLTTNSVYIDVLWFNGAIVDGLAPYVTHTVPVKLGWSAGSSGNPYLVVEPLVGPELAAAQQWANANPNRFETERAARQAQQQQAIATGMPPIPGAPSQPPSWVPQAAPPVQQPAQPPATPPAQAPVNVNDPAIQALLQQIASGQTPGA